VGSKHAGKPENLTTVDETHWFESKGKPPLIREFHTKDDEGNVIEYALTYIDFSMYAGDNGRVLGYDNAHGIHERHFMGSAQEVGPRNYASLRDEFFEEVANMRGGPR